MIGIVRWVTEASISVGDSWMMSLREELASVIAAEPGQSEVGEVRIYETTIDVHPHAEATRPAIPARLYVAEASTMGHG